MCKASSQAASARESVLFKAGFSTLPDPVCPILRTNISDVVFAILKFIGGTNYPHDLQI